MAIIPYDPDFTTSLGGRRYDRSVEDKDHDASVSAANVAAALISSARFELKMDSVYTEYSARYLVDNASTKNKKKMRGKNSKLTVKKCLEFAFKRGIPKAGDWPSRKPVLVSMKGEVIEAKSMEEACDLLTKQQVGVKVYVFSPQIDLVGEGVYCGSSGEATGYVELRDGIITNIEKIQGKSIATVKLWYKNKFQFFNVAVSRMFADGYRGIHPTTLLCDFCVPRLSIN